MSEVLIKPESLKPGDTIGILSPAGVVRDEHLWDTTTSYFESKGYKVKIAQHAGDKKDYLAGRDEDRANDINTFFKDDSIKAIICSRGGYGSHRILDKIDYELIKENPKIFCGYSDITALHAAINKFSGVITFHGPLALSDFGNKNNDEYTINTFFEIVEGKIQPPYTFNNPCNYECLYPGQVKGKLAGGNLAVLVSLLGTKYFPDLKDKILLLEDIGEPLYKIDRMLMQLKLAGIFEQVKGILFADFTGICKNNGKQTKADVKNLIKELLSEYKIPAGYGFPASHEKIKATLPLGVEYEFNADKNSLSIIDKYIK